MLLICYGTRPEYIKVKSLIDNLPNSVSLFTGQHTSLIGTHNPTYTLNITNMSGNRLNDIICSVLKENIFVNIDYVLVQGDTTSAMAIALSAFNHGVKIIHLEAGLRTYNMTDPFPEEMNRQLISRMATIHLCPTEFNKQNLIHEHVCGDIYVTGNTGLDNIDKSDCCYSYRLDKVERNAIVVTLHRRDNISIMASWFGKLNQIAMRYNNLQFIFPMHPNPDIQKHKHLLNSENIQIINPVSHSELISLMKQCKFIISDSGGIQEEASFLNKRIIVCRQTTERPETIGTHTIMCHKPDDLPNCVDEIYNNFAIDAPCPYGDGNAWVKIKNILMELKIV